MGKKGRKEGGNGERRERGRCGRVVNSGEWWTGERGEQGRGVDRSGEVMTGGGEPRAVSSPVVINKVISRNLSMSTGKGERNSSQIAFKLLFPTLNTSI